VSILVKTILLATLLLLAALPAHARPGGIVGYADIGCAECHSALGAVPPAVTIEGPTTVEPGAEATYRVVVRSNAVATQIAAGFNVAASAGELLVGSDSGVRSSENRETRRNELAHTGPRENDGSGEAAWSFRWRAPTDAGPALLFAAGNSVNLDLGSEGDADALAMLAVQVGADPTPTPTATPAPACAGDCNGDGVVAINELILGVNIALGAPVAGCPAIDANGDGAVAINELIAAVGRALSGC